MIVEAAAVLSLAIWVYLVFARGRFWLEFYRRHPVPGPLIRPPSIVAIIPARNEADVVGEAIRSLCAQKYPGPFHIVLVDDGSTDGTAEAARAAASGDKLTVVTAGPLPEGWSGKLWALAEGVRSASRLNPDLV